MWEKEQHKTSYRLIGKSWTFVRDNTTFRDLSAFVALAQKICDVVPPEKFFQTYNLDFIQHLNGTIELIQTTPARHGVPPARNLSDFELLDEMLENGLPVDDPRLLGKMMGDSARKVHVMDVQKHSFIQESPGESGRAAAGFTLQMNFDPISACAELLQLDSNHNIFDNGVNVLDVESIEHTAEFDPLATGPQTYRRYQWVQSSAHIAQPQNGAIDLTNMEENIKMYDFHHPNMFDAVSHQSTESNLMTTTSGKIHRHSPFI